MFIYALKNVTLVTYQTLLVIALNVLVIIVKAVSFLWSWRTASVLNRVAVDIIWRAMFVFNAILLVKVAMAPQKAIALNVKMVYFGGRTIIIARLLVKMITTQLQVIADT
jgi:hypothetical protein